jgi:hypothetical protein
MPSQTGGTFEMLWDCPSCGTEKLLGLTHRHCPACGAAQDPQRRYFPADADKVAVENHPWQGRDRACPACDTPNAAKAGFCTGCGSPMEGAKEVGTRDTQAAGEGGGFAADSASAAGQEAADKRRAAREQLAAQHAGAPQPPPTPSGGGVFGKLLVVGFVGVFALICLGVLVNTFWRKEAALTVTQHSWERTIAVETFSATTGSAWRDQVPAGAAITSCRQEQREQRSVADGEDCVDKRVDKGDGTFTEVRECTPKTRSEPVYADKCDYTVNAWVVSDTRRASGVGVAPPPSWPQVVIAVPGICLGCQREGQRTETYTITLHADDGADHACTFPADRWGAVADGSRWKGTVGMVTGGLDCEALAPG